MKRVFTIAIALAVILSLSYTFLMAQESREESEEARDMDHEMHNGPAERDEDAQHHMRPEKDMDAPCCAKPEMRPGPRCCAEHDGRMPEMPDMMCHRLMEMFENQMHEIRALREEIAELRGILIGQGSMRWRDQRRDPEPRRERERREPERRDVRRDGDIEGQIREVEAAVERRPDDIELRMRLAHLYREVNRIQDATMQYKAALGIDPAFDPPYHALEELGHRFPDMFREREEPLEDSAGEVISANEAEIVLKTREGETVTFKVPSRRKEDGSWVLNEDFSELAKSLEPGERLIILWREVEGQRVIRRIEKMEEAEEE